MPISRVPGVGLDTGSSGVALSNLSATGTPSATTFLRGDNTWAAPTGGFSNMQVFTSSGTFTVPAGITKVKATVVGGGGGGPGSSGTNLGNSGAGGGGAAIEIISGLTPGSTVAVTVGAGGAAGTPGNNGGTGGTSSFGAFCSATGGGGGTMIWSDPGAGGLGSGGDLNIRGQAGQWASFDSTLIGSGGGGSSILGGGAQGRSGVTPAAGVAGGAYGGGGSGSTNNGGGAAGGAGVVIVEW